ncbi:MAG: protein-L-isoaspartate O-methyltransferase [Pseudomonadota bacterium]
MDFTSAREHMVLGQVRTWDVVDDRVLDVMSTLPREAFLPEAWRNAAYADISIPIGDGERSFTPRLEGRILQAVDTKRGDRVLEVGCGSGYLSACLAQLGGSVIAMERHEALVAAVEQRLTQNEIKGVEVSLADASETLPDGRFDVIVVGGAIAHSRTRFESALQEGGRLFVVEGKGPTMTAFRIERLSEDRWQREALFETRMPYLHNFGPKPKFEF